MVLHLLKDSITFANIVLYLQRKYHIRKGTIIFTELVLF